MTTPPESMRRILSEVETRWLLDRAIELDHGRSGNLTLEQLRAVSAEAGISAQALEAALAELPDHVRRAQLGTPQPGHGDISAEAIARNVVPVVAGLLTVRLLLAALPSPSRPALIEAAFIPAGLLIGYAIAGRLRAPLARFLLAGLALATGFKFLLTVVAGEPIIRGAAAHWQLIAASYLAVWALAWRKAATSNSRPPGSGGVAESARTLGGSVLLRVARWVRDMLGPRTRARIASREARSSA